MNHCITLLICLTIQHVISNHENFEYSSDCLRDCILKHESCTISLEVTGTFDKECYTESGRCEDKATPFVACLQFNHAPEGGQLIWELYKEKYYPSPPVVQNIYNIYFILIAFVCGSIIGVTAHRYCRLQYFTRRADYESIRTSQEVYRDTVEPILDIIDSDHE